MGIGAGAAGAKANGGDTGIQGHIAVGGAALFKLGLIAKVFDDGVQRLYDGGVGVLGSGGNVAVLFVIPGDGVFAPSGGLLVGGLLEGVPNAWVFSFSSSSAELERKLNLDGGTGHDGHGCWRRCPRGSWTRRRWFSGPQGPGNPRS